MISIKMLKGMSIILTSVVKFVYKFVSPKTLTVLS